VEILLLGVLTVTEFTEKDRVLASLQKYVDDAGDNHFVTKPPPRDLLVAAITLIGQKDAQIAALTQMLLQRGQKEQL
jgi:hypothetical protein